MTSLKKQDVISCMFSEWYPKFRHLSIKSYILSLPEDFVKYLLGDGPLFLPKGVDVSRPKINDSDDGDDDDAWSDEETQSIDDENSPEFPEVIEALNDALKNLKYKAFVKSNWSAPKDAVWITANNSLNCATPGEVILLLKSSEFITYDLTSPFKLCDDSSLPDPVFRTEIVLRKWANLVPGMEFRCFVKGRNLIAACQRNHDQYYEYLEQRKEELSTGIFIFLQENVLNEFQCKDFVVDIYKKRDGDFWIIDFNPWGSMTDPLLFSWDELISHCPDQLSEDNCPIRTPDGEIVGEFRITGKNSTMQPSNMLSYRMPQDFVDLSTGEDATKLIDLLRLKTQNGGDSSSDEDETWRLPDRNST